MPVQLIPTIVYQGSPGVKMREMKQITRRAAVMIGGLWHRRYLPKHFTPAGAREYNYQKRTAAYMRRKARVQHHQNPIQWSGETKLRVCTNAEIKSLRAGAVVKMWGPRHLYAYRKDYKQPNKAAELVATSDAEMKNFTRLMTNYISRELNRVRDQEVKKLG